MQEKIKKVQYVKIGLYLLGCILGILGVSTQSVELSLLATLIIFFAFINFQNKNSHSSDKMIFNKYEITSDQFVLSISLFVYAMIVGAIAAFLSQKLITGTISLILWILAIGLFLAAGMVFDQIKPFGWIKRFRSLQSKCRREIYIEIAIVFLLTVIALLLRVLKLDVFPTAVHGDEGEIGMVALQFLGVGDPISPFGFSWSSSPNLSFLWRAGFIAVFGRNEFGLRIMPALFGTACVPIIYLIGRKFWGKIAGFTGAWLMTVSHFFIQYSRIAIGCIEPVLLMLLFIYLFLSTNCQSVSDQNKELSEIESKKRWQITPYIWMGIIGGLAQYLYVGSRLIPLVAFCLILYQLIRKQVNFIQIAILILSAVIVFAPPGLHFIQHPQEFTSRLDTVSIFNPDNIRHNYGEDATLSNSIVKVFSNQFKQNFGFFIQSGDRSSFYYRNIPAFDSITAILFWLGLGVVLSRPRRLPELTLIILFFLGFVIGGVITNDSPSGSRLIMISSSIFIIIGVFVQRTWDSIHNIYKKLPDIHLSLEWIISPIYLAFIIATFFINYNYYFVIYPDAGINILSINIAEEVNADASNNHVYLFGEGNLYANHGTIRFFTGNDKVQDLKQLNELPPLINDGKGITVLATYSNFEKFAEIESIYPGGILTDEYRDDKFLFMKYQIPPTDQTLN